MIFYYQLTSASQLVVVPNLLRVLSVDQIEREKEEEKKTVNSSSQLNKRSLQLSGEENKI